MGQEVGLYRAVPTLIVASSCIALLGVVVIAAKAVEEIAVLDHSGTLDKGASRGYPRRRHRRRLRWTGSGQNPYSGI